MFDFVKQVNGYITEQEPWKVAKDDSPEGKARLATILYTAAESLRAVAVLLNPVMPETSRKLWDSLGAEPTLGALADQKVQEAGTWGLLPAAPRSPRARSSSPPGGEAGRVTRTTHAERPGNLSFPGLSLSRAAAGGVTKAEGRCGR